jgi:Zn-dependent peptidase ImmA (M78 family)/DNA-binding XRE family transcriptional regulator
MNNVFAKRLKSARVMSHFSQDQLVKNINGLVTKNAISKYEKGVMMPNSNVLLALSKALNVKPDYFYREFSVSIENIEFRKRSKLGIKKENAIKEQIIDVVSRYLELEQFLNIQSTFINPLEDILIHDKWDIEHAANKLLQEWNLGVNALPNVIDLLEDKEIKVIEIDAPSEFDGSSGWADGKIPVIVLNKNFGLERKRLTALHELAHLLLKFDDKIEHRAIEKMCFQFGGAMLMSGETFIKEIGLKRTQISTAELIAIKETYGMSIQAIMARAKVLEVISDFTYIRFNKWISRNRAEDGLGEYVGREESNRFMQLLYRAASEEIISMSKAANLSNQKLALFRQKFVAI